MNRPALSAGGRRVIQRALFLQQFPSFMENVPPDVPLPFGTSGKVPCKHSLTIQPVLPNCKKLQLCCIDSTKTKGKIAHDGRRRTRCFNPPQLLSSATTNLQCNLPPSARLFKSEVQKMNNKDKRVNQISSVVDQINDELQKIVDLRVIENEEWTEEDLEVLLLSHQSILDSLKTRNKLFDYMVALHQEKAQLLVDQTSR